MLWYQLLIGDFTRELHAGWADELAEEFDVPQKQIDILQQCVGYLKKRPASAREVLAMLPPPALPNFTRAGSPGASRITKKSSSVMPSSVGTIHSSRRRM